MPRRGIFHLSHVSARLCLQAHSFEVIVLCVQMLFIRDQRVIHVVSKHGSFCHTRTHTLTAITTPKTHPFQFIHTLFSSSSDVFRNLGERPRDFVQIMLLKSVNNAERFSLTVRSSFGLEEDRYFTKVRAWEERVDDCLLISSDDKDRAFDDEVHLRTDIIFVDDVVRWQENVAHKCRRKFSDQVFGAEVLEHWTE